MNWDIKKASTDARIAVAGLINRLAEDADGEIRQRPVYPGATSVTREAEPTIGIRAALAVQQTARNAVRSYIATARSDGMAWYQIGDILVEAAAITDDDRYLDTRYNVAVAAFEYAAGPAEPFRETTFGWTCPACGKHVSDHGPYDGNPRESESGHAVGCTRLAAAIRVYEAAWEDE